MTFFTMKEMWSCLGISFTEFSKILKSGEISQALSIDFDDLVTVHQSPQSASLAVQGGAAAITVSLLSPICCLCFFLINYEISSQIVRNVTVFCPLKGCILSWVNAQLLDVVALQPTQTRGTSRVYICG